MEKCRGIAPDDLPDKTLPTLPVSLQTFMSRVKASCDKGLGFAAVNRLNLEGIDQETAIAVSWTLGRAVSRQVAQKWDGSMLYIGSQTMA